MLGQSLKKKDIWKRNTFLPEEGPLQGYQYYLEHLSSTNSESSVGLEFQREFQEVLKDHTKSVEDVLTKSCQRISERTKMATVVLGPKADQESLVSIQLLSLNDKSARFIFITDSGYVEKKTLSGRKAKASLPGKMQSTSYRCV